MASDFKEPVNIGSEEMVTINQLAEMVIKISGKDLWICNVSGRVFKERFGYNCPLGVRGRNSDNKLYREKIGWEVSQTLVVGLEKTYKWINEQINNE